MSSRPHNPELIVHHTATLLANRLPEAFAHGAPALPPRPFRLHEDFSEAERCHFISLAEAVLDAVRTHERARAPA
jgi:hypothetical protein